MYVIKVIKDKDIQYLHPGGSFFFTKDELTARERGIRDVIFTDIGRAQREFNHLKKDHSSLFEDQNDIQIALIEVSHYDPNAEYKVHDYVQFRRKK